MNRHSLVLAMAFYYWLIQTRRNMICQWYRQNITGKKMAGAFMN